MKKIVLFILFVLSFSSLKSQCDEGFIPNGFVDFLDTNQNSHTLNDYLLSNKIVVLDFYVNTCGLCMASSPCMESIFQNYGWNNGDVIVLAFDISGGDPTDDDAIQFAQDYGMPNVPNFSQKAGAQNTIGFWYQFDSYCGDGITPGMNGGLAQSYILRGNFCCGDPTALNYEIGCSTYNNSVCIYEEGSSIPSEGVTYVHQGGVVNCDAMTNHIDNLLEEMITLEENNSLKKQIVNTTNLFGQSVRKISNQITLDIYNDGSVKKKFIFE